MKRTTFLIAAFGFFGWVFARDARAEDVFTEFTGTRSAAMGNAHTGVANSNDAIYLNPAGMVLTKRYSLALQYGYSPFDSLNHFNASVVDSKSGPVTGAMAYTRDWGDPLHVNADLSRIYAGSAYALSDAVAFGAIARYVRGKYTDVTTGHVEQVSVLGGDIGLIARLGQFVGLGVSYENAARNHDSPFTHEAVRGGAAISAASMVLAVDGRWDLTTDGKPTLCAGAEYFASNVAPIRAGYMRSPYVRNDGTHGFENLITGGLGWVDNQGSVDVSVQQSVERRRNRSIVVGMQIYM